MTVQSVRTSSQPEAGPQKTQAHPLQEQTDLAFLRRHSPGCLIERLRCQNGQEPVTVLRTFARPFHIVLHRVLRSDLMAFELPGDLFLY